MLQKPTLPNITWHDVVSLLKVLCTQVEESRSGSRVGVFLNGVIMVFHKPHPGNEMKKSAVDDLREFLTKAGITL